MFKSYSVWIILFLFFRCKKFYSKVLHFMHILQCAIITFYYDDGWHEINTLHSNECLHENWEQNRWLSQWYNLLHFAGCCWYCKQRNMNEWRNGWMNESTNERRCVWVGRMERNAEHRINLSGENGFQRWSCISQTFCVAIGLGRSWFNM